ncbi:MAG: hypothetical protein AAF657_36170 [Acidobacteriota bacterium]
MSERKFRNIWYLPKENAWASYRPIAYRDSGELVVSGEEIRFLGKKKSLSISSVKRVSLGKQGWDFVNKWVKVEHEEGVAFFADGSALGWGGVLGGTKKLFSALEHMSTR